MIIAIDGPAGAGKSSVTKEVAKRLGFACLDTGAMYRSVAWQAVRDGVAFSDETRLGEIARSCEIEFRHEAGDPSPKSVLIAGVDVTSAIRTAEIDKAVSPVSAVVPVREALIEQQRRIGLSGNYVVEGRDIGTVVFPEAEVKVFLTASNEERARRRVLQNQERGVGSTNYEEVLADIIRRDEADSSRAASPLEPAADAVILDSTAHSIEEVVEMICELGRKAQRG